MSEQYNPEMRRQAAASRLKYWLDQVLTKAKVPEAEQVGWQHEAVLFLASPHHANEDPEAVADRFRGIVEDAYRPQLAEAAAAPVDLNEGVGGVRALIRDYLTMKYGEELSPDRVAEEDGFRGQLAALRVADKKTLSAQTQALEQAVATKMLELIRQRS